MGLDIGDSRIGVALSDPGGILASPLMIIDRRDDETDVAAIAAVVSRYEVGQIIAGLPRSMDGSTGRQAEKVAAFTARISGHIAVPVAFRDERLTTVSAQRLMRAARGKKKQKRVRDDAVAAALILQGYLDENQQLKP
ncbi:Holliday junction resolvase RuvX [Chloroflexota bacterium]